MAVVKGFTDLMKGTLSIQSELGVGSTFMVELPFDKANEKERELVLNSMNDEELSPFDFKDKRVLLVEDNALNAEIATELLENIGLKVDWAENGELGVQKFEQSEINFYFPHFLTYYYHKVANLKSFSSVSCCDCLFFRRNFFMPESVLERTLFMA